jgi:hypothetical protein
MAIRRNNLTQAPTPSQDRARELQQFEQRQNPGTKARVDAARKSDYAVNNPRREPPQPETASPSTTIAVVIPRSGNGR